MAWLHAPHRVLRAAIEGGERAADDVVGETVFDGTRVPVPRLSAVAASLQRTGTIEAMCLYAGQSVRTIRDVNPAAAIVREPADGADALPSARRRPTSELAGRTAAGA